MLFYLNFSLYAQLSITNTSTPFNENFNSLALSGPASGLPVGKVFLETGTGANTTYGADDGTVNSGNTYSYGVSANTERAFGTGTVTSTIGVQFINNSGSTITALSISYTGEQWRLGTAGRPDRLDFQYSTDATSLTGTGTWAE